MELQSPKGWYDKKPSKLAPQEAEGWEERFDLMWEVCPLILNGQKHEKSKEELKAIFRSELQALEERLKGEMVEDLRKIKKENVKTDSYNRGYNIFFGGVNNLIQKYSSKV